MVKPDGKHGALSCNNPDPRGDKHRYRRNVQETSRNPQKDSNFPRSEVRESLSLPKTATMGAYGTGLQQRSTSARTSSRWYYCVVVLQMSTCKWILGLQLVVMNSFLFGGMQLFMRIQRTLYGIRPRLHDGILYSFSKLCFFTPLH